MLNNSSFLCRNTNNFCRYPRGRGRPRDPVRNQRPSHGMYQQGPGSMVRPTGPYGSGRSNTPTFPGDSPTSPPGQGRNFSKLGNQSNLPPRFLIVIERF